MDDRSCGRTYRDRGFTYVPGDMICAGGRDGVDTCQGGSGGPMVDIRQYHRKGRRRVNFCRVTVERFGTDEFYGALGRAFVAMCAVIPVLFAVELLDRVSPLDLEAIGGIWPRHIEGLDGVVFAPFLHADFAHLYGNSVVLIPLGTFALAAGTARFIGVTVTVMLAAGLGVWFTGDPDAVVIGASGVIFGYLGYLLVRGVVERSWWNIAVAVLIGILYGWQLVGLLPTDERISWQGHLFGFAGGVLAAVLFRRRPDPGRYADIEPRAPDEIAPVG